MTKGTDRAHKIPHGDFINLKLGPVLDFTILRFGLALERDDAPSLWADKVKRLGAYWLPIGTHTGAEQAEAFVAAIEGFPVRLAALDREASAGNPQLSLAECRSFFRRFKALRPDLKLGIYGTRFTCRDLGADFDWIWMASEPFPGQRFDMRQKVMGGVDRDEWVRPEDFDEFFGGEGVSVKDLEEWSGMKADVAPDVFAFIRGELLFAQGGRRPNNPGPRRAGFDFAKQVATVAQTPPTSPSPGRGRTPPGRGSTTPTGTTSRTGTTTAPSRAARRGTTG